MLFWFWFGLNTRVTKAGFIVNVCTNKTPRFFGLDGELNEWVKMLIQACYPLG
jgi:hypothetical protein